MVSNERGWCTLRAVVTDDVPPGVTVSPKGRWASLSADRRNVNWLTPDAIADLAGQSTYHSNLVHVRPATAARPEDRAGAVADRRRRLSQSPSAEEHTMIATLRPLTYDDLLRDAGRWPAVRDHRWGADCERRRQPGTTSVCSSS